PSSARGSIVVPEGPNAPYEAQIAVNDNLNAAHWVTIPPLATDAYVRAEAQLYLTHSRVGSKKYLELSNEPWNPVYSACQIFALFDVYAGYNIPYPNLYGSVTRRSGQVRKIWKQVFDAAGRGDEIV